MRQSAPVSYHLDLYRYWLEKRGSRVVPSRADIDPAEVFWLLPFLCLVDKVDDWFRYRLVGTAIVQQFGVDVTGRRVGSQLVPESAKLLHDLVERVISSSRSHFTRAQYKTTGGTVHSSSTLYLPLSDCMLIFSRLICHPAKVSLEPLARSDLEIKALVEIDRIERLRQQCSLWEDECLALDCSNVSH
jgi:hypothetical protein